jgi:DNA-binding NarL/FixJ family response regulator
MEVDMEEKIKVMLIEDNKLIRVGIKTLLEETGYIELIAEADNGKQACELAGKYKPDIILLDIGLPDMTGIRLINDLYSINNSVKIIILTSHDSHDEINKCISGGVYAYVIKDIKSDMLINVIRTVYEGGMWFDPKIVPSIR